MLFQGQEFLEGGSFSDTVPVDRDQCEAFYGIVKLYSDLIGLRLNRKGFTRGLCGQHTQVYHLNDEQKVIAYHRWDKGGAADDVVVIANFFRDPNDGYIIGFPAEVRRKLRFNSDGEGYNDDFENHPRTDLLSTQGSYDGFACPASVAIGSYSVLFFRNRHAAYHAHNKPPPNHGYVAINSKKSLFILRLPPSVLRT
ncbi:MAG: alpha amylase C-terminal domain-containing protein [Thiovulaceae bacterium]|nr:alpha amylase C-terminal domain-containing protein [Sulfurimonadaceae bacterium]